MYPSAVSIGVRFMNTCFAMLGLSGGELVMVLAAILILFGAKKIPEFAKGLGQGIKEFKKASSDVTSEFQQAMHHQEAQPSPYREIPAAQSMKPSVPTETASTTPPATVPKA